MENSKELKPCPFCGGPAERVNIDPTDEHEPNCGGSYIFCPSCLACSKVVFGEKIGLEEAWNMRTTHDRALEALDAAIRKECADRAVEWVNQNLCDEHMPIMYKRLEENELRAAIEGKP